MILIETRSQNNTSIDECDFVMSNINEEKKKKKNWNVWMMGEKKCTK
jgi:hypothetical protein